MTTKLRRMERRLQVAFKIPRAPNLLTAQLAGGNLMEFRTTHFTVSLRGGFENQIGLNANSSVIGGGANNAIGTNASGSVVGGGNQNQIDTGNNMLIAGGFDNTLLSGMDSAILGGSANSMIGTNSVIVGGYANQNCWGNYSFCGRLLCWGNQRRVICLGRCLTGKLFHIHRQQPIFGARVGRRGNQHGEPRGGLIVCAR